MSARIESRLTIDESRCVHRLAVSAQCRACVQSCPRSAWSIDDDGLGFDDTRCDACGLCTAACPTGALSVSLPWPTPHARPDGTRSVTLRCERASGTADAGATVPCAHAVDEARLLRWHADGVSRLDLDTGSCADCERRPAEGLPERLARVNSGLSARGRSLLHMERAAGSPSAPSPPRRSVPAEETPNLSRRRLFGLRQTPIIGAPVADPFASLAPRDEATRRLSALGTGPSLWSVTLDPTRCDACGACARLCPTQAISSTRPQADSIGWIALDAERCIGCALCVDVCDPTALTATGSAPSANPRSTWTLIANTCSCCGKTHTVLKGQDASAQSRCPACRSLAARPSDRIVQEQTRTDSHDGATP